MNELINKAYNIPDPSCENIKEKTPKITKSKIKEALINIEKSEIPI